MAMRKYGKIANELRSQIDAEYRSGQALPSDKALARSFGVSVPTIRHAMRVLAGEDMIIRNQGKRTIVAGASAVRCRSSRGRTQPVLVAAADDAVFFREEIVEIQCALYAVGLTTAICRIPRLCDAESGPVLAERIRAHDLKALVIGPVHGHYECVAPVLENVPFPVVFLNSNKPIPASYVCVDNGAGAYQAAQHLHDIGCRRIRYLGGMSDYPWSRGQGFARFVSEQTCSNECMAAGAGMAGTYESGYRESARLLQSGDEPDGIIAQNDLCALGVIAAAKDHGVRVPDDLAIIGADDIAGAASAIPSLTTISPPKQDIGYQIARILKEAVTAPESGAVPQVLLQPRLVIRDSTRGFRGTRADVHHHVAHHEDERVPV